MLNHVTLQGHLGAAAEIRELPNNGGRVARMRVAQRESWKKDDQWQERVNWLTVVTYRQGLIDNVIRPRALKGAGVILTGKLQDNSYKDSEGRFHQQIEIVIAPGHELQLTPKDGRADDTDAGTADAGADAAGPNDSDPADTGPNDADTADTGAASPPAPAAAGA